MSDTYRPSKAFMTELVPECAVLLVDDDPNVLDVISEMLTRLGCEVNKTRSPDRAVEILKDATIPIDLLVTDFSMKEMNGSELVRAAFRLRPRLKALFMSGDPASVSGFRSADPFLLKPFSAGELKEKLDLVLRDLPLVLDLKTRLDLDGWVKRESQPRFGTHATATLSDSESQQAAFKSRTR